MNDTQLNFEFKVSDNKKYKVEGIWDSMVYARELVIGQLLGFYYLILQKDYLKEENTWEPTLVIQYF